MEERILAYGPGDRVRIIKYGHIIYVRGMMAKFYKDKPSLGESPFGEMFDIAPEMVGQEATIDKADFTQGIPHYSLDVERGKAAWYDEEQLELIGASSSTTKEQPHP